MSVRGVSVLFLCVWCLAIHARAQGAAAPPPASPAAVQPVCFDMKFANYADPPNVPFLINRCTGATWMLTRDNLYDAGGRPTGNFAWRWTPLNADQSEGQFANTP